MEVWGAFHHTTMRQNKGHVAFTLATQHLTSCHWDCLFHEFQLGSKMANPNGSWKYWFSSFYPLLQCGQRYISYIINSTRCSCTTLTLDLVTQKVVEGQRDLSVGARKAERSTSGDKAAEALQHLVLCGDSTCFSSKMLGSTDSRSIR